MPTIATIKLFFQPAYFLNPYPSYDLKYLVPLLAFFIILLVAAFVFLIVLKRKKKNKPLASLLGQFTNSFFWFGILGLLLIFFRYEGIPFVSARALLFFMVIAAIIWPIITLIFGIRKYKKSIKEFNEKQRKEKYFKKKK